MIPGGAYLWWRIFILVQALEGVSHGDCVREASGIYDVGGQIELCMSS